MSNPGVFSTLALWTEKDEYFLCWRLEDCRGGGSGEPSTLPFHDQTTALYFLRSVISDSGQMHDMRLWLQDKNNSFAMYAIDDHALMERTTLMLASGQLAAAAMEEGAAGGEKEGTFRLTIDARLGITPVPVPIAVWLLARNRVAGPVRILAEKPQPRGIEDEEVTKFLAAWRKRNPVKPQGADTATVWPEETVFGTYPRYRKTAESPPMPDSGIVLWAKPLVVPGECPAWPLTGFFRLAIPRRHVVLKPLSGNATTAVVPITLIITSNDIAGPFFRHLQVPSHSSIKPLDDAPVVEGHFNINLLSFFVKWRAPRTYFVYAVCGNTMSPPSTSALLPKTL